MKFIIAFVVGLMFASPAHAQFSDHTGAAPSATMAIGGPVGAPTFVTPPAPRGVISISQPFAQWLQPYIDATVNALILAFVGWLANWLNTRFHIDLDQKHRDALTKALQNQAGSLIADGMVKIENGKINVDSAELRFAANAAMNVIPGAAKHFGLTPQFVADRIVDTIPQIAAGAELIAKHAVGSAVSSIPTKSQFP